MNFKHVLGLATLAGIGYTAYKVINGDWDVSDAWSKVKDTFSSTVENAAETASDAVETVTETVTETVEEAVSENTNTAA